MVANRSFFQALLLCGLVFVSPLLTAAESAVDTPAPISSWHTFGLILLSFLPVLAILAGVYLHERKLRSVYIASLEKTHKPELLHKSPSLLPEGTRSATIWLVVALLIIYLIFLIILKLVTSDFPGSLTTAFAGDDNAIKTMLIAAGTFVFFIVVVVGFLFYMQRLQKRFFEGCLDDGQLSLFFSSPAGLPSGTVRAMIALIIVIISMFFISLQFFGLDEFKFPEALTTLLGAVVAFYFATRASKGSDETLQNQVQDLKKQRDEVTNAGETNQANTLIGKIQKGISLAKGASALLPESMRKKYVSVTEKLETGLNTVEVLMETGNAQGAADSAGGIFKVFAKENPVFDVVSRASASFTSVLGPYVPALLLITTVAGVGIKLVGAKYQKWKNRILHAPLSPVIVELKALDSNSGLILLRQSEVFSHAFASEIEDNDREFFETSANDFLSKSDLDELWQHYKKDHNNQERPFESRQQFVEAVERFRRSAADQELEEQVDPSWVSEIGGYSKVAEAIDKIHEDPRAKADLDELLVVLESLQQQGQPVSTILAKVQEELKSEGK